MSRWTAFFLLDSENSRHPIFRSDSPFEPSRSHGTKHAPRWNQFLLLRFMFMLVGVYSAVLERILNVSPQMLWELRLVSLFRSLNTGYSCALQGAGSVQLTEKCMRSVAEYQTDVSGIKHMPAWCEAVTDTCQTRVLWCCVIINIILCRNHIWGIAYQQDNCQSYRRGDKERDSVQLIAVSSNWPSVHTKHHHHHNDNNNIILEGRDHSEEQGVDG